MPSKMITITIIVIAGCLLFGGLLWEVYHAGGQGNEAKHDRAIIKTNNKLRKSDAKIAKSMPVDDAAIDSFLLAHTRQ